LPFVATPPSTLPRTRSLLCALTSCSIDGYDQAIIAGVAAFLGSVAARCQSSSSWHSIRIRAYSYFCANTTTDVAEEDARALFSCLVYHELLTVLLLSSARSC
jgi:hypothetical protein